MTHGSLFSGMGGFDLAAEWAGWTNAFHCEWNEFGQKVLKYYWPQAESFSDITKTNFSKYANTIDILTGGFPCQPYSQAGKRLGKEDDRHLWPEMLRAIREIKPSWVVGENVYGLVNWNGGLVFHEVQSDLEAEGYEVWPFLLPAVSVNAPHRRDRIWFVAYSTSNGKTQNRCTTTVKKRRETTLLSENKRWESSPIQSTRLCGMERNVTNSKCQRSQRPSTSRKISDKEDEMGRKGNKSSIRASSIHTESNAADWETFPTVSPICTGDDGLSTKLDGITFSKWRKESIKAGGNAIVPQVALQIFNAINQFEKFNPGTGVSEQL